jgi:hypothetical protein
MSFSCVFVLVGWFFVCVVEGFMAGWKMNYLELKTFFSLTK